VKRLLSEPLVHFLLLGALLFGAYGVLGRPAPRESGEIVVTQGQIASLVGGFDRFHRRPPTAEELEGLIREAVKDEVLYREAKSLGLDREDAMIRQRLRQKMEFVSDRVTELAEPSDAQLSAFLRAHPDLFRVARTFTFEHIFLDPQRHGSRLGADAGRLLAELRRGKPGSDAPPGDPFLLESRFVAAPDADVSRQFGEKFAAALAALPLGQWEGPVASGYGMHLVFVSASTPSSLPPLEAVRADVLREWQEAERKRANEGFYASLLARYTVRIESSEPARGPAHQALAAPR
jgi:hypothetical protein